MTSILQIKSKPGLDAWKQKNAIMAALTLPKLEGESDDDFAERVLLDSQDTAKKAASIGNSLHAFAEDYCNGQPSGLVPGYETQCYNLQNWIDNNLDLKNGRSEWVITNLDKMYAGRIDWCGLNKEGAEIIIDFKTQSVKTGKQPNFYDEWAMQLAAYSNCDCNVRCLSVVISTNSENPGIFVKEWDFAEIETGWNIFIRLAEIWRLERNYNPMEIK